MGVDCGELCFPMSGVHHLADSRLLLLWGINQDEIRAAVDVVVEFRERPVFGGDALQAAFPGAVQYRESYCCKVYDGWEVRTERLEKLEQSDANHSGDDAECGTYKPVA